jgi:malonyl CoA-acyl carrier protein transacylase
MLRLQNIGARASTVDKNVTRTLLELVAVFREALTEPGYRNFIVLFVGWVLTQGDHAVTQALVVTTVAERVHWERYHRFFSRGTC